MTVTQIFKLLVVRYRLMSAEEFYNLDWFTLSLYLNSIDQIDRDEYERMRFLGYCIVQCQSTKQISPEDIIRFPWDSETKPERKPTTAEDFKRITEAYQKMKSKKITEPRILS